MIHRATWSLKALSLITLLLFSVVALAPLAYIFISSIFTDGGEPALDAYGVLFDGGRRWSLMCNSVVIASGTALIATLPGMAVGFAIEYLRISTRRLLMYCVAVPFLIPPYIWAVAWIDILGNNGLASVFIQKLFGSQTNLFNIFSVPGVIFIQALSYYPIVVLTTVLALRRFDGRLEEAANMAGGRFRTLWSVTLPIIAPSVFAGSLFIFLLALISFSVPSLLQVNVFTVEIYSHFSTFHNFRAGAALSMPILLCGAAALACWSFYIRPKQAWLTGSKRPLSFTQSSRSMHAICLCFCWSLVFVSAAAPLALLVWKSLPLNSFIQILISAKEEIAAGVLLAAVSATLILAMAFAMAYLSRLRYRWQLYPLSIVPFLVSGPVLGIGLIATWNHPGIRGMIYDGFFIMVLACTAKFTVFAHHGIGAVLRDIHPNIEEAASVAGVGQWRQVSGILLPMLAPAMIGAWGLTFLFCLGELDTTLLVMPPGWTTLPVRLFTLMHYGPSQLVYSLSVITVFMILIGAGIVALIVEKAAMTK